MMDVHEADGVVPSDTEGENDDSTSSSPSSSDSSTMMLFDKPQPLVLELHELKKTEHSSTDRQTTVPLEQGKGRKQPLAALNDKTKKLKKKRKSSNASKLTTESVNQPKEASDHATALSTAAADSTKEEFFDAQDTVLSPTEAVSSPDSSSAPLMASDVAPLIDSVGQEFDTSLPRFTSSIVSSPLAKLAEESTIQTKLMTDAKLVPGTKLDTDAKVAQDPQLVSDAKLVSDAIPVPDTTLNPEVKLAPDAKVTLGVKTTPGTNLVTDPKMAVAPEGNAQGVIPKELSQPNVRVISQPQSVTSHRSANAMTKPPV